MAQDGLSVTISVKVIDLDEDTWQAQVLYEWKPDTMHLPTEITLVNSPKAGWSSPERFQKAVLDYHKYSMEETLKSIRNAHKKAN